MIDVSTAYVLSVVVIAARAHMSEFFQVVASAVDLDLVVRAQHLASRACGMARGAERAAYTHAVVTGLL